MKYLLLTLFATHIANAAEISIHNSSLFLSILFLVLGIIVFYAFYMYKCKQKNTLIEEKDKELQKMQSLGSITHCPRSNRLLGNGRLSIEKLDSFTLGTDGMSSNDSLSLWDEMRAALMLHHQAPVEKLAKRLIMAATKEGALALGLDKGVIAEGKDADLIMIELPDSVQEDDALALSLVMFTKEVERSYVAGLALA